MLKSFYKPSKTTDFQLKVLPNHEAEYQLISMHEDFERTTCGVADPRVKFRPDGWQKQLLDIIDCRESALVCAPTASGKTFAGYYAVDLTLRLEGEDSVVVFVVPTKPLLNQVLAEVNARFSTKSFRGVGKCLAAGLTSDNIPYGWNNSSQVIVTLPSVLELLLVSAEYKEWSSKIKYVVLDEIHCIGEDEGGAAWEHLVHLIPSPFLALSATVGNKASFVRWWHKAQLESKLPVHLITHTERYADLNLCVFGEDDFYFIHPFAFVSCRKVSVEGLSGHFYLTAHDALQLYTVVINFFPILNKNASILNPLLSQNITTKPEIINNEEKILLEKMSFRWEWLEPSFYFIKSRCITKRQYRFYLVLLRIALDELLQSDIMSADRFNRLIDPLLHSSKTKSKTKCFLPDLLTLQQQQQQLSIIENTTTATTKKIEAISNYDDNNKNTTYSVIKQSSYKRDYMNSEKLLKAFRCMESQQLLPALLFHFDRMEIEEMGTQLIKKLVEDQRMKYYGDEEKTYYTDYINKRRMDKYHAKLKEIEIKTKLKGMSREQKEDQGLQDDIEKDEDLPTPPKDIADEHDEEFSFANVKIMTTYSEVIEREITRASKSTENKARNAILIEGMRRGIGIHHDSLPKRIRDALEILFRLGYLRILIADKTMAYGVNMPCRTTFFVADSVELTPLLFRQMSGRAGRRGYDTIGHVMFWNFPISKIRRLLHSPLPVLSGNFPVTPSTMLRLLRKRFRFQTSAASEDEIKKLDYAISRLFTQPLFLVGESDDKHNDDIIVCNQDNNKKILISYFVRFTLSLLHISRLINPQLICSGLSWLVEGMFECEPSNLVFNFLFLSGFLEEIITNDDTNENISSQKQKEKGLSFNNHELLKILALCISPISVTTVELLRQYFATMENGYTRCLAVDDSDVSPVMRKPPDLFMRCVTSYNHQVIQQFARCVKAYSSTLPEVGSGVEENIMDTPKLPLSSISYKCYNVFSNKQKVNNNDTNNNHVVNNEINNNSPFQNLLSRQRVFSKCRSPFAALKGKSDEKFKSASELCSDVREEIHLTPDMLPVMNLDESIVYDLKGRETPVLLTNSLVMDFTKHGNYQYLVVNNGISRQLAWVYMRDFVSQVKRIYKYLEEKELCKYEWLDDTEFKKTKSITQNMKNPFNKVSDYIDTKFKISLAK